MPLKTALALVDVRVPDPDHLVAAGADVVAFSERGFLCLWRHSLSGGQAN